MNKPDTLSGYGKTWPLVRTRLARADVHVRADDLSVEQLRAEIESRLEGLDAEISVEYVADLRLSRKDQIEHDTLERAHAVMGP